MTTNHQHGHRQRLRDRFLIDNGKSMPDYEILELLLSMVLPRKDVKPLAKTLICKFETLNGVINAPIEDLLQLEGIGKTVATHLKIVGVASIRSSWQKLSDNKDVVLSNYSAVIDFCISSMRHNKVEVFKAMFLDSKNKLITQEDIQTGTIDAVYVYPREIVNIVLKHKAKAVILAHNHPSGDPTPSKADTDLTKKIIEALKSIDVVVWDHVIVADTGYYSFQESGLLSLISTTSNI